MRRLFIGGFALGVCMIAVPALAESPRSKNASLPEPAACEVPHPAMSLTPEASPSVDEAREAVLVDEIAHRYVEFVERQREREQREFELAAERYLKFREFTLKLQEQQEREIEQSFNQSVELYLRKQEFTKQLLDQRRAAGAPPPPAAP